MLSFDLKITTFNNNIAISIIVEPLEERLDGAMDSLNASQRRYIPFRAFFMGEAIQGG
jgi:hypothetical protein